MAFGVASVLGAVYNQPAPHEALGVGRHSGPVTDNMILPTSKADIVARAAVTASRLRMIQVDHADDEDARREHLSREIERASTKVDPSQRRVFLRELMKRFPAWQGESEPLESSDAQETAVTQTDGAAMRNPVVLAERLAEMASDLSERERQTVAKRLQEAGLIREGDQDWPEDATRVLRDRLRLGSQGRIDPARALRLVAELADFACTLDQLAWKAWSTIAPQSAITRQAGLRPTMGRFFASDDEAVGEQVLEDLEKVRHLIAALLSGATQAGRQFARRYLGRFSPAQISALAEIEPGGFLVGHEQKCWRKYVELAESMDPTAVEHELMEVIRQYAETLLGRVSGK